MRWALDALTIDKEKVREHKLYAQTAKKPEKLHQINAVARLASFIVRGS